MIRRVLLVDDEADIRKVAALTLTHVGGWEVLQASSGREALEVAMGALPDVILLDVMMPGMDGPSTFEAQRAEPATASIPVIFVTAKVQASERTRIERLGAAGVIAKPFDAMQLPEEIERLVSRARVRA